MADEFESVAGSSSHHDEAIVSDVEEDELNMHEQSPRPGPSRGVKRAISETELEDNPSSSTGRGKRRVVESSEADEVEETSVHDQLDNDDLDDTLAVLLTDFDDHSRSSSQSTNLHVPGAFVTRDHLNDMPVAGPSTSTQHTIILGKQREPSPSRPLFPDPSKIASSSSSGAAPEARVEPLSEFNCPICLSPPTNATLIPCGHICCGACLFAAVKATMKRGAIMGDESSQARCPVCRSPIRGWDGKGGGVVGLKVRAVFSI